MITLPIIAVVSMALASIAIIALHLHFMWRFHAHNVWVFGTMAISLDSTNRVLDTGPWDTDTSKAVAEAMATANASFLSWCRTHEQLHRNEIPFRFRRFYLEKPT